MTSSNKTIHVKYSRSYDHLHRLILLNTRVISLQSKRKCPCSLKYLCQLPIYRSQTLSLFNFTTFENEFIDTELVTTTHD